MIMMLIKVVHVLIINVHLLWMLWTFEGVGFSTMYLYTCFTETHVESGNFLFLLQNTSNVNGSNKMMTMKHFSTMLGCSLNANDV